MKTRSIVCLDVGEKRIGVAVADTSVRIAVAFETVNVDGSEIERIAQIIDQEYADTLVIGYPRNQLGESTAQTSFVELFAQKVENLAQKVVFQDESLTSVLAEEQLKAHKKPYTKGDIDAQAAAIILQDYLESNNA
jgi:putative Holliday junction resolvase